MVLFSIPTDLETDLPIEVCTPDFEHKEDTSIHNTNKQTRVDSRDPQTSNIPI